MLYNFEKVRKLNLKSFSLKCSNIFVYKSSTHPRNYVVMERYVDNKAWQSHKDSEYGKVYLPKIRSILESVNVEYYKAH